MSFPSKKNWNEFDWEKELRKDDERVNTYMRELPKYIDLPDEDGVIMKQIQRRPELVPHGGIWPSIPVSGLSGDDELDDELGINTEDILRRDGGDIYVACGKLARCCCILFSSVKTADASELLLRMLCLYGKIMARVSDIIDMDSDHDYTALKISLCKRIASDVNEILGLTERLSQMSPEMTADAAFLMEQLQLMRERIIDLLQKSRSSTDTPLPPKEDDEDDVF